MLGLAVKKAFENPEAERVQLNVFPENSRAMRYYEKAGFVERKLTPDAFAYKNEFWGRCNMVFSRESQNPWREISRLQLFCKGKEEARKAGAQALYISACSSEETIAFYKAMGGKLTDCPIKRIADDEPYDLQMVCYLEC